MSSKLKKVKDKLNNAAAPWPINRAKVIIKPTVGTKRWDNKGIYRSSFIYENDYYYVFYGGTSENYKHGIGFMYGKDIFKLKKVNTNFKKSNEVNRLIQRLKV